jgi:hypothetical protein
MAGFDPDEYLKSSAKPAETGKPPKDDGFDPDAYLKDGGREKSAGERFKEPLKTMSFEDWQKNSIIAPAINYVVGASPFGTEEQYQTAKSNLTGKIGNMVTGIGQAITSPVETATNVYNAIKQNPAGAAGNIVKGAIYDPELLFAPGVRSVTAPVASTVAKTAAAPVTVPYNLMQGVLNAGRGELGSATSALRAIDPMDVSRLVQADRMSPVQAMAANAAGNIPKEGQLLRAIGENVARGYTEGGIVKNAAYDVLPMMLGSPVPLSATAKASGSGLNALINKNAFSNLDELKRIEDFVLRADTGRLKPGEVYNSPVKPGSSFSNMVNSAIIQGAKATGSVAPATAAKKKDKKE